MNYTYFSKLEDGSLRPGENQSEQSFMEQILSAVFSEKTEEMDGRVNDRLDPQFVACDLQSRSMSVAFQAQEWMLNPNGTLHGGMLSTCVDMAMSVLSRYLSKKRMMVTAQLSMNFLRSVQRNETFTVHVTADHVGRRSVIVHAHVSIEGVEKKACTATAVLM